MIIELETVALCIDSFDKTYHELSTTSNVRDMTELHDILEKGTFLFENPQPYIEEIKQNSSYHQKQRCLPYFWCWQLAGSLIDVNQECQIIYA